MKTSFKILVSFATITLISLIVVNLSLKAKYKNGDFDLINVTGDVFELNGLDTIQLKDFKHLVINGALITKNKREVLFTPHLQISSSINQSNVLGIAPHFKSLVNQHVSNDTLYIYFQKNNINENNLKRLNYSLMILKTNNLQSLNTKNLTCNVENLLTRKPFVVTAEKSGITMTNIKSDLLTLRLGTNSYVNLLGSQNVGDKIENLKYSLAKGAYINIPNRATVGKITCLNPSKNINEFYNQSFSIVYK